MASVRYVRVPRLRHAFLLATLPVWFVGMTTTTFSQERTDIATHVGSGPGQQLGVSTAIIGDLDHDGCADYLIGVPGARPNGIPAAGSAFLYSGRTQSLLHRVDGTQEGEGRAWVVALGDVDRDGTPDYAVGSPMFSGDHKGSIWIFSGATHTRLREHRGPDSLAHFGRTMAGIGDADGDGAGDLAVASLRLGSVFVFSGATGDLIRRIDAPSGVQDFGFSVAGVGDVDGDGFADLLVGAPARDGVGKPTVFVYSPKTGSVVGGLVSDQNDHLGTSVSGVGDVNRDGCPDWVVGAPNSSTSGLTQNGTAYVISGATNSSIYSLQGANDHDLYGWTTAGLGYFNGDSIPDFAVGSPGARLPGASEYLGAVVFYSGKDGAQLFQVGPHDSLQGEGVWIAGGGDLNGDGADDALLSASMPNLDFAGRVDALGFRFATPVVLMDLMPEMCPNRFPIGPDAFVRTLVLGGPDFAVSKIAPETVRLNGVPGHRIGEAVDAAGASSIGSDPCECREAAPDGRLDQAFDFPTASLASTFPANRTPVGIRMRLTGRLHDGSPFEAVGCFAAPSSRALVAPNPMRPADGVRIALEVPVAGTHVRITIHDVRGRLVRELAHGPMEGGPRTIVWDGRGATGARAPGGLYFVTTLVGGRSDTNRVVLVP